MLPIAALIITRYAGLPVQTLVSVLSLYTYRLCLTCFGQHELDTWLGFAQLCSIIRYPGAAASRAEQLMRPHACNWPAQSTHSLLQPNTTAVKTHAL